jgi:hypothetical protein
MDNNIKFNCSICGERHDLAEISFGANAPIQWNLLSDVERKNSELTGDQCVIQTGEGRHFFVRACLDIPIKDTDRSFTWGVWVSLSERSFEEMCDHWEDPNRNELGPYFGWLCTKIPGYPDTVFLKTDVRQREVGLRPLVELEQSRHPLALHQYEGITVAELESLVADILHDRVQPDGCSRETG